MTHDELRDSIPALALNALPEREQLLVETHVSRCAGCSFEYSQYQEVAALLAHLAPAVPPPAALWQRIEACLAGEHPPAPADGLAGPVAVIRLRGATNPPLPTEPPSTNGHLPPAERPGLANLSRPIEPQHPAGLQRPGRWRSRFSAQRIAGLAAAAVLVVGGAGIALFQRSQQPQGQPAQVHYEAIESGPHTVVLLRATAFARGATGEILVAPDGKVAVAIHGLAAPSSGTYTMWLAADGQTRSLGDFRPDASGEVRMATAETVGHTPRLVVTLESRHGNTSPAGPSVLGA